MRSQSRPNRRVIMVAMAATAEGTSRYQFKAAPYSSHKLLLTEFPERGEGRRVLDVGCAIGYLSEILAQRGFAVTSIDWPNSPHPPTVEFAGADLDNGLPPLRGQFEYIICADVLEHLRAPVELLKECRARLAPGGMLVGSLPNSGHFYFRWNVLMGRFPQHQVNLLQLHAIPVDLNLEIAAAQVEQASSFVLPDQIPRAVPDLVPSVP